MKKAALAWLSEHQATNTDQKLPDADDLEFVIKRDFSKLDPDKEADKEKLQYYLDLLDWYVKKLVPTVAGCKLFDAKIRHFEPLSSSEIPNSEGKLRVPPSTEAFTLLMYKNCKSKWEAMHNHTEIKKLKLAFPRYSKREPEQNKEWNTLYSDAASGQNKFGGWKKAGLKEFIRLQAVISKAREEKERVLEVDKGVVSRLYRTYKDKHEKLNEDGTKKRKADEISGENEEEDEEELVFAEEH